MLSTYYAPEAWLEPGQSRDVLVALGAESRAKGASDPQSDKG
jgi:hypothetical protein